MKSYKELKEAVGGFGSFYSKSEKHAEIGRDHDDEHKSSRPAQQKIYHKVAFKDKESAKAEGMRYDGDKKKWYHTSAQKSNASKFVKEEVEQIDEIKLKTVGKIIKHSPKIASAAIGAAVAAHSAEAPKQPVKPSYTQVVKKIKEEVELDEAVKLGSKVKIHAPGKDYHGEVGHVGEIRHGAYKGAAKTYTVDYGNRKSVQLDKKNVKLHKEEVELDEVLDPSMGAGEYVKDFQKSDAPQFKGKSQEKRRMMGIAAYMAAKREKNK